MKNRLQELRWENGWSQEQLSLYSRVGRSTISEIENGTTANPSVSVALKLAKTLNVSVEDVFIL